MNLPPNPTDQAQCGPNPGYTNPVKSEAWTQCMNAANAYTWWTWEHILLVVIAVAAVIAAGVLVWSQMKRKERA